MVARDAVAVVSDDKLGLLFSAEKGLLLHQKKFEQDVVAIVKNGEGTQLFWVTENMITGHPIADPFKERKIEINSGKIVSASSGVNTIELEVQENGEFCSYQVDFDLNKKIKEECRSTPRQTKKTNETEHNCVTANNNQKFKACLEGKKITLYKNDARTSALDTVLEAPVLFSVNKEGTIGYIFTERATLVAFTLESGTVTYVSEESLGVVVGVYFFKAGAQKNEAFSAYEASLRSWNIIGAWRQRIQNMIPNLANWKNKFASELSSSDKNFLKGDRLAVFVTEVGKLFLFDFSVMKFTKQLALPLKKILASSVTFANEHVKISQENSDSLIIDRELALTK